MKIPRPTSATHDRMQRIMRRFLRLVTMLTAAAPFVPNRVGGDPAPLDDYGAWIQEHFPATYLNLSLEPTIWGDNADPDGDGCGNLMEFVMHRNPNASDAHLGVNCRIEGGDMVMTFRETTATNHGIHWLGEWSGDLTFWITAGLRYEVIETHIGYQVTEARISKNREQQIFFRLKAVR
jgi:hypothetical protein